MTGTAGFDPLAVPESNATGYPRTLPRSQPATLEPAARRARGAWQFRRQPHPDGAGRTVLAPARALTAGRVRLRAGRRGRAWTRCRYRNLARRHVRGLSLRHRKCPSVREPIIRGRGPARRRRPYMRGTRCPTRTSTCRHAWRRTVLTGSRARTGAGTVASAVTPPCPGRPSPSQPRAGGSCAGPRPWVCGCVGR